MADKLRKKVKEPLGKKQSLNEVDKMIRQMRAENCARRSEILVSSGSECSGEWKQGTQKTEAEKARDALNKQLKAGSRKKWWI